MHIQSTIKLYGSELQLGETVREICPYCEGGSQSEKSLVITRTENGGLVWVCHRATCQTKGGTHRNSSTTVAQPIEKKKPRKTFTGSTTPLSDAQREKIRELWGITEPSHWYWTPEYGGRIAMSIRSPTYTHRGWVLRDIRGAAQIKALTYIEENEESLSWYKTDNTKGTILVEDIPSAVRASRYTNAVALLGTGIGTSKAAEIEQYATRPIVVAYDQDATSKAFDQYKRYGALWGDIEILMLEKDIKDMEEEDICRMFT